MKKMLMKQVQATKSLWKTKWSAQRMVIVMVAGFGVGFVYYGVQLNVENLNFNLYISAAALIVLSCYRAGVACILCTLFGGSWTKLIIAAIGFMGASIAFDMLYVYCVELFPTNVRNFAVSMLRQALMSGASLAPLLAVLGRLSPTLSFLLFGALSITCGFLSIWLPETRNAPLYETLKQQEEEEIHKKVFDDRGLELGK
ncbi:hypothetical protein RIF29_06354 [Crotalaria pallida]|uniref:Uncharacterized protein n=1 Tax=Crotalaria pallida TaxID=3830 RepID=A0AAN9J340_CROPI